MTSDQCFNLGYVVKAIGLKGEISVYLDTDNPENYKELESVYVEINKQPVLFFIDEISIRQKNIAVLKLKNVNRIEEAEKLKGCTLLLPLNTLPDLGDKNFYYHEIPGYLLVDTRFGEVGIICETIDYGTNVVGTCEVKGKEILFPLLPNFIEKIDRINKLLFMKLPEGLIDVYLNPQNQNDENE